MLKRFPQMHEDIRNLALGDHIDYPNLDMRELTRMRGEVLFYQGHVEPHDNRFNDPDFPASYDDWNWRIKDELIQNPENPRWWILRLHKIETPDEWRLDGVEMAKLRKRREREGQDS